MNKRPGQIKVVTETGFCSFCDRTRNLRREERQLGALVRTVIACESCHRILSSTIGVAEAERSSTEAATATERAAAPVESGPEPEASKPAAAPSRRKTPAAKARGTTTAGADAKPADSKSRAPARRNRPTK
ncbi:MAG: hypothetical protein M3082_21275 [Candidatus Dormibacteraeota bacterium]|nr:hypothetical protein [Candidatus Dormibacteraeota bacterium]